MFPPQKKFVLKHNHAFKNSAYVNVIFTLFFCQKPLMQQLNEMNNQSMISVLFVVQ